jgi:hypothetical protein
MPGPERGIVSAPRLRDESIQLRHIRLDLIIFLFFRIYHLTYC